jgi:hypothetical protein
MYAYMHVPTAKMKDTPSLHPVTLETSVNTNLAGCFVSLAESTVMKKTMQPETLIKKHTISVFGS